MFVGVNYAPFVSGGEKHRRRASSSVRLRHREDDCRWMLETLAPRGFDDPDGARVLVDDGHEDGHAAVRIREGEEELQRLLGRDGDFP